MNCSANDRCFYPTVPVERDVDDRYDRYGIYAGLWHDKCWDRFGYGDFVFDPLYAGEHLEEEW